MRIGITCYPTYGGSGAVATELGLELARRGHEIHFISYASPFRLRGFAERVTFHEVTQFEYPLFEQSSPYALALAVKQHEVAKREQLDLMHAHYAIPHAATAWLAKQMLKNENLDLKIVTTLHGTDITLVGQDPSYFTLTKFSIEQSDAVTAVSAYLRDETYRAFGCGQCDLRVIPNFISTTDYHPPSDDSCRKKLAPKGHRVLVHVSNFRPVKRVAWLLRAFEEASRGTNARLTLVGDGPDSAPCRKLARELGIHERVVFLGERDALPELLAPADVFVLSSSEESFGLSALEAMSCGTPVVSTRVGGVAEVVEHGVTGLLAEADDLHGFAARLKELLFDRDRAQAMGVAARASAERRFARDQVIARYEALYCRLLARDPVERGA